VFFSIVYNTIVFVVVVVIVVQMRRQAATKMEDFVSSKKQSPWKDVRFVFALFTLTGLSWLFGFFALFSPALSWAWYLFVIFSTTQALAVSFAFLFTRKVLRLYRSLLCCSGRERHTKSSMRTTRKPQVAETNAENS
jgi:formate hydrogenlyase subunit 3/multisubunit Na+/H+ antiporter MnhD subunit